MAYHVPGEEPWRDNYIRRWDLKTETGTSEVPPLATFMHYGYKDLEDKAENGNCDGDSDDAWERYWFDLAAGVKHE
jgi:hypothetical protein